MAMPVALINPAFGLHDPAIGIPPDDRFLLVDGDEIAYVVEVHDGT